MISGECRNASALMDQCPEQVSLERDAWCAMMDDHTAGWNTATNLRITWSEKNPVALNSVHVQPKTWDVYLFSYHFRIFQVNLKWQNMYNKYQQIITNP